MRFTKWTVAALLAVAAAGPAQAAFITSLYGTGLNANGTTRNDNDAELHYTMIGTSPVLGTPFVYTQAGGFPIGPWLNDAASATSRWIAPITDRFTHAPGDTTYRTTFDLTGFVPGTASLTGQWATDNAGLRIILNGTDLGVPSSPGFGAFTTFATGAGAPFVAGTNTLDFVVNNDGGSPGGLRVEIVGTADLDRGSVATPLPPTALLALFALGVAGVARRRRA